MLRAIVFDFDGVIADTEPLHYGAFAEVLGDDGVMPSEPEYFARYVGLNDETFLSTVFARAGRSILPAELAELRRRKDAAYFARIAGGMSLLPGVDGFIRRVRPRWTLGICSGARRVEIETILRGAKLLNSFRVVVTADEVAVSKPDPAGFRSAVKQLGQSETGLRPAECLAIEDSLHGLTAARAAGLKTLLVSPSPPADSLASADLVAPSLASVTDEVLMRLFR